jgi:predicted AlkP superfamily phosphohydrolase/phosphomutase
MTMQAPLTRVLIIGADSADPDLLERWGAAGDLPNLMRLRSQGSFGRVANALGCDAGSAWSTFHSGLNPGRQPQYDGMRYFDAESYRFKFYPPQKAAPTIFDELSEAGKRCFVMDAPFAHLARTINGISIVDWGAHDSATGDGKMVYETVPKAVAQEILDLVGPDPRGGIMCDDDLPETIADYRRFLDIHLDRIRKKTKIVTHFLAKGGWDYFEPVYCDIHCVGHDLWHINDKSHPRYRADFEAALGEPLRECFRVLDEGIGQILSMIDERTLTLFYASHGIGPQYTGTGLLDRILDTLEKGVRVEGSGRTLKGRLRGLWRSIPPDLREAVMPIKRHFSGTLLHDLFLPDREKRRFFEVYCTNGAGGVRINLKGREAHGIVEPAEYENLLLKLTADLMTLRNAETGAPLIQNIVRLHEVFPGPYAAGLPDLALIWNRTASIRVVTSEKTGTIAQEYSDARTGDHTNDGLFIAAGRGIRAGGLNHPVRSVDFAPTIRGLFALPARATDGEPISTIAATAQNKPVLAYSRG